MLFKSLSEEKEILQSFKDLKINQWIQPNQRFGVKVTRVQREPSAFDVDDLQKKIGSQIWHAMEGQVKINLTSPDVLFLGVIHGTEFYFGPHLASRDRAGFYQRRSPLRPFFVPSALHPKIARVMVNLSRITPNTLFVDPFCGTGGLLLEAAKIGCTTIGLDIDAAILAGCKENLKHFQVPFNGILADARAPPIRNDIVEAIATDPPYGRSSSTKGSGVLHLIQVGLPAIAKPLKSDKFLCLALPLEYYSDKIIPQDLVNVKETHTMRIHRSLRRHIIVLERKSSK